MAFYSKLKTKMANALDFKKTLKECLKDAEFAAEYERLKPEFQIKVALIKKRLAKKLTQAEVAKLSGLKQSNIARLESASGGFSLETVAKYAKAVGLKRLVLNF